MKNTVASLLLAVVLLLSACNGNESTLTISQDEEQSEEEVSEASNVNETDEMEEEEVEEETEEENTEDEQEEPAEEALPNAEEILQQSFEAMSNLTAVYMESVLDIREEMSGNTVEEERKFNTVMLLEEPFSQRMRLTINSDQEEPVTSEIYKVDGKHYIYRSFDDMWMWMDDPEGVRQLSPLITEDTLENHLRYSDRFEVTETEEEYLLTFSGTYNEFFSSMFGGAQEMLTEIERERPPNIDDIINSYSILIEKDRFYVVRYNIYYERQGSDNFGDYFVNMDGYVLLGNYNQYNDIEVPEEIISEAVPAGE